jgi:ribose 5-phosphate isomerase B
MGKKALNETIQEKREVSDRLHGKTPLLPSDNIFYHFDFLKSSVVECVRMKIYIGADHRGFSLKQLIVESLTAKGHEIVDLGAPDLDVHDDYTVYAEKVAREVVKDASNRGILLCGSGVGVDIVANKIDGIRASIGLSPEQIVAGRKDDDMNILVIAAEYTQEEAVWGLIDAFISTDFDEKESHKRRLMDIAEIEENN